MSVVGMVVVIVLILFVREEILSAHYKKEIKRAQKAYERSMKILLEDDYVALPVPREGAVAELSAFSCCEESKRTFIDAA